MSAPEKIEYEEKIRRLLVAVRSGDRDAFDSLIGAIAPELRKLSGYRFSNQPPGHTLQPTALVSEVVLRLMRARDRTPEKFPQTREHFLALATRMMRFTLADSARRKRGLPPLQSLDSTEQDGVWTDSSRAPELEDWSQVDLDALLDVDRCLRELEASDPELGKRRSDAVGLHIFGGLSFRDIARELRVSEDTSRRDCLHGLAQLRQCLSRYATTPAQ